MTKPSLWDRLKRARIVQVLVVYLGACWGVLQLADVLQSTAGLPEWVGAFTLLLLAIGLVIILSTAWVQSLPSTTAAEEAGERPTDWEIDPADVLERLRSGRLPHLTWGRAILGGVMALSLLFGGAGAYVLVTGGRGLIGPAEVGANEAAAGIAVLPFNVRGAEFELYREGMVDLLSTTLDGVGGYRAIDSRTVLARWSEEVGVNANPDLDLSLRAAGRTGARYALLGNLVPAGAEIRMAVEIYDLGDGRRVGSAEAVGSADGILAMVDAVSVGVARELLGSASEHLTSDQRLASITTGSLQALEAYLEGERLIRAGDFEGAVAPLERAVAADSTFALAWGRLAEAFGWVSGADANRRSREARDVAVRFIDRLSPREATLTRARALYNHGDPQCATVLHDFVRRYPDEADAWYALADSYLHLGNALSAPRDSVIAWFRRAVELDPGYAGYVIHLVDLEAARGNEAEARALADTYRASGARSTFSDAWAASLDVLSADPATRERGLAALPAESALAPLFVAGTAALRTDFPGRELAGFRRLMSSAPSDDIFPALVFAQFQAGAWKEAQAMLASPVAGQEQIRAWVLGAWHAFWGLGDVDLVHRAAAAVPCEGARACLGATRQGVLHGAHPGYAAEVEPVLARMERLADDARSRGDSAAVAEAEWSVADTRAWIALQTGDPRTALGIWRERVGKGNANFLGLAMAAEAAGDLVTAERYYHEQAWGQLGPFATYRLAALYERTGRPAEALAEYRRLLVMFEEADEDFPPLLEARAAVARLGA